MTIYIRGVNMVQKAFIDWGLNKLVSRKLLVWTTATVLAGIGFLSSSDWVLISGLYIGTQSVIDSIVKLRGGRSTSEEV
jgi:hypothetical protein